MSETEAGGQEDSEQAVVCSRGVYLRIGTPFDNYIVVSSVALCLSSPNQH